MEIKDQDIVFIAERFINHTNRHVFLTGKAGTGKTTFLKKIINSTHKKTIVTAPTGIAALNAGGVTLHSQFQLPFGGFIPARTSFIATERVKFETQNTILRHLRMNDMKRKILRESELLIIDEVSMLRADTLDAIDFMLKALRRNSSSFGGMQVLFIGDMMQLPPIVKDEEWEILKNYYESPFFFDALVLKEYKPVYVELDKIYRQQDKEFTDILNNVRYNTISTEDADLLNKHYRPGFKPGTGEGYITLTTHNRVADAINQQELDQLPSAVFSYKAVTEGEFPEHLYPGESNLVLKKGAQVMFSKNDISGNKEYYNGKIGIIDELGSDFITVLTEDHKRIDVQPYEWTNIRYIVDEQTQEIREEQIGRFVQYPLRLAWAITIHKSQGLTFDRAVIDIKNVFASGQAYVALSRLRSLSGLVLSSPFSTSGIDAERSIISYEKNKELQGDLNNIFGEESLGYLKNYCLKVFDFQQYIMDWQRHISSYDKAEERSEKQNHLEWAKEQLALVMPVYETCESFKIQLRKIFAESDQAKLVRRLSDARDYYSPKLQQLCSNIIMLRKKMELIKRTKAYVNELEELEAQLFSKLRDMHKAVLMAEAVTQPELLSKERWDQSMDISWRTVLLQAEAEAPASKKRQKGATFEATLQLHREGKDAASIAKERNLTMGTIQSHYAKLIAGNTISIYEVMEQERIRHILSCITENEGKGSALIKELLGNDYSYGELNMVLAHHNMLKADVL